MSDKKRETYRKAAYMVEATGNEQIYLHMRWGARIETWEEVRTGNSPLVGTFAGHAVRIEITYARLNGHLVGFYSPISTIVDHRKVEKWIVKNCGRMSRDGWLPAPRTNASNFKDCLNALGIPWKKD